VRAFYETECRRAQGRSCASASWNGCTLLNSAGQGLPCTNSESRLASNIEDSQISLRVQRLMGETSHSAAGGGGGFSVEQPHNHVHMDVGWPMSSFQHAPFNPIFWLHHCNIDRLYEAWIQAYPGVRDGDSSEAFTPFTTKLHGANVGSSYTYRLGDVWDVTALGYSFDSIATTSAETKLLTAGTHTEVVFDDVDFKKLDSMFIEVVVSPAEIPFSAVRGKSCDDRKTVYGSGYCGKIGIFSEKGKGELEDLVIDCSAAVGGSTAGKKISFFCITGVYSNSSAPCTGLIDATPKFVTEESRFFKVKAQTTAHLH